jgi:trigger factor
MDVSTRKTNDLNAVLTVKIDEQDYREKVDQKLKDYRKKADMPGFRKGKVPLSLIKKQYGKSLTIDEVNKLIQSSVMDHIQKEELNILGSPLPVEQTNIDWDQQKNFSFDFELGLAPDFELKVNGRIKVPYHKIVAEKDQVDHMVEQYARQYGQMSTPKAVEKNCLLRGPFTEVKADGAPVEEGIKTSATFDLNSIDHSKTEKELLGKKVGDTVILDAQKAFKKDFSLSNLLGVSEEELNNATQRFSFQIEEISKVEPAELNQELFDKVFGEGAVDSEEAFRQRVKEDMERNYLQHSDQQFYADVKDKLLEKMPFELPEGFLKKWLVQEQKDITEENIDEKFPEMKDELRWQLIESRLVKEHNIEVSEEDLKEQATQMVMQQMAQFGQAPQEEMAAGIAENLLENKEQREQMSDQAYAKKLLEFYKEHLKVEEKEVSYDQFIKKVTKK